MNLVNNVNRDVFVGEIAKNIAIKEEITFFGFSYLQNGIIHYDLTETETDAFNMQQTKINLCPTPIEALTQRTAVTFFAKEHAKVQLQEFLLQKYPEAYFGFLAHFNACESTNQALPLLEKYLNNLTLDLTVDRQQANYNLVDFAYRAKQINECSYLELIKIMGFNAKEPPQKHVASDTKRFSGIGYFQANQPISYYSNAYLPNAFKQQALFEKSNYFVSPVLHKSYHLAGTSSHSPKGLKEDFTKILQQTIDIKYMELIRDLKTLPSAINSSEFYKQLNKLQLTASALCSIDTYAKRWNVSQE